jgi:hypothetical protein
MLGTPLEVELSHCTLGGGSYHRVSAGVSRACAEHGLYLVTNTLEAGSDHACCHDRAKHHFEEFHDSVCIEAGRIMLGFLSACQGAEELGMQVWQSMVTDSGVDEVLILGHYARILYHGST